MENSKTSLPSIIDSKKFGIEPKEANQLLTNLPELKKERDALTIRFDEVSKMDIDDPETAKLARELRLQIRDNRTKGIMDWHKNSKEVFLRGGQFVDAIKNQEITINERMERLLGEVEKHAENVEKARIAKIQEDRVELVRPYLHDAENLQLGTMDDDVWEAFLSAKKKSHREKIREEKRVAKEKLEEEKKSKIRNEREEKLKPFYDFLNHEDESDLAEWPEEQFKLLLESVAESKTKKDAEIENQRIENERLKNEAEETEKKVAEEKAVRSARVEKLSPYIVFIRDYEGLLSKSEEDFNKDFVELHNAAVEQANYDAQVKADKEAQEKKETERIAAENIAKEEAKKLAKAPVRKQLNVWVDSFDITLKNPELTENETAILIRDKFIAFKKWAKEQVESV